MSQLSIFDNTDCPYTIADYQEAMKRLSHAYNVFNKDRTNTQAAIAYRDCMREKEKIRKSLKERL